VFVNHLAIPPLAATPFKVAIQSVLGVHWMVTPDRPLTLVHATQQPVCAPQFESLHLFRNAGQTWAEIRRSWVRYHARSSAKLEALAEWMEWIDDVTQPAPVRKWFTAQLPEVAIASPPLASQEPFVTLYEALGGGNEDTAHSHIRHEFGDHKFRLVLYSLRATTRFAEYLPESVTADAKNLIRVGPVFAGHTVALPANYENVYPDPDVTPSPDPTDAELGAPLLPVAQPLQPGNIVPCSRRPEPPKIAYVVPTFRWEESRDGERIVSIRRGNGLRVYLERPWFSSGEGELLGVVVGSSNLAQRPFKDLPPDLVAFVSQWGQDPIVASDLPRGVMRANAFGARVATFSFTLPEATMSANMEIAAHRVHYDFHRRLWYADLEIDAGWSYNPFLRLALVRVQPHAVGGCELSEVAHTQYAQLLPTRELHLHPRGREQWTLDVYGIAPTFGSASGRGELMGRLNVPSWLADAFGPVLGYDAGRNRIEMVVQEQTSGLDTDLDWTDVAGITPLTGDVEPGQTTPVGPGRFAHEVRPIMDAAGAELRSDALMATRIREDILAAGLQNLHLLRDDLLFSGSMTVHAAPEGARRRLMVREYERHFGDFTVTDSTALGQVTRPAVTERLIFAREFYVLSYVPPENARP
jgi:hypothetical protein